MRVLFVGAAIAAIAVAGCSKPPQDPLTLEGNLLTVDNRSSSEWTNVEIWLNTYYRVTTTSIPAGGRFQVPLDAFVAGFGQRFNFRRAQIVGVVHVLSGSVPDQGCGKVDDPQAVLDFDVPGRWKLEPDVEYGGAEKELRGLIPPFGCSDQELLGNRPIAYMKAERLLRAQAPFLAKTIVEVVGGERPKRRVPTRALSSRLIRAGWRVPALHHLTDESGFEEALAMRPGELAGADRNDALVLQSLQGRKRLSEFFRGCRHGNF